MKQKIKKIIYDIVKENFEDDESLIVSRNIDSMDVIDIATSIERQTGITINGEEITVENFDTINNITQYVLKKLALLI